MNVAVTDGVDLMPPAFIDGLDDWSSEDGTPGSATYDGAANAALVASDPDFGSCLEILTDSSSTKLRYMGEVPVKLESYLEVKVRIKVMSGAFPSIRIAGWAGLANGNHVTTADETGPYASMNDYGRVYTVSAIIGAGKRTGVDMIWGTAPRYGHFGIDIVGAVGTVVRIESVAITDVTSYFHRKMLSLVDVRDFGAVGNGVTDDVDAFEAADAEATSSGRDLLVSDGSYYLGSNITLNAHCRFDGTVQMPDSARLQITKNFNLPTYVDAFGNEQVALKKALQALFNYTDHESLDMCGLRVQLSEPIDVHAAVGNRDTFANRRVLRNGQLEAVSSSAWNTTAVSSTASYSSSNSKELTSVTSISSVKIGSLVVGNGVGREVYVTDKDVGAGKITLSQPLHSAASSQSYTFVRFQYLLDFSGFDSLQRFQIEHVEFGCFGKASGVLLPKDGIAWHIHDCWFTKPKDRGVTSIGTGCNGMSLYNNEFLSNEYDLLVQYRKTIAYNTNSNDLKIRDNRAVRFLHFGVMNGGGHMISGNHFWQGDGSVDGERSAGIVLTQKSCKTSLTGNYADNAWIELNNEHDVKKNATASSTPFGTLSLTGNIFTSSDTPAWFTYIRLAPFGNNYLIDGISVVGNTFKTIGSGTIDRVDAVDTSDGNFDHSKTKDVQFTGNSYEAVVHRTESPVRVSISKSSVSTSWTANLVNKLPFGGQALGVDSVMPIGVIEESNGTNYYGMPYALTRQGSGDASVTIKWGKSVEGKINVVARVDLPS